MFYSGWRMQGPVCFDTTAHDGGRPVALQDPSSPSTSPKMTANNNNNNNNNSNSSNATRMLRLLSGLGGSLSPDEEGGISNSSTVQPSAAAVRGFHIRSDAPLVPQSGLSYVECRIVSIESPLRKGLEHLKPAGPQGVAASHPPVPLVLGVCRDSLPSHRLPGEEVNSIGFFLSQRTAHSHGKREGERLALDNRASRHGSSHYHSSNGGGGSVSSGHSNVPNNTNNMRREVRPGDSLGCLVNFFDRTVRFTFNGQLLDGFTGQLGAANMNGYYFAIGMQRRLLTVSVQTQFSTGAVVSSPAAAAAPSTWQSNNTNTNNNNRRLPRENHTNNSNNNTRSSRGFDFDLAAYSYQFVSARLHRDYPRLYNTTNSWAEGSLSDSAMGAVIRQFAAARGMSLTLRALDAELDAMAKKSPRTDENRSTQQKGPAEKKEEPVADPLTTITTSSSDTQMLQSAVAIARSAIYRYSDELAAARRLFLSSSATTVGGSSSSGRGVGSGSSSSSSSPAQFFLLHSVMSPSVRAACAAALHVSLEGLDKHVNPQFWLLWFFSKRQDVLYTLKALQAIEHTVHVAFSQLRFVEVVCLNQTKMNNSNGSCNSSSGNTHHPGVGEHNKAVPSPPPTAYLEASIMASFSSMVLEPFARMRNAHDALLTTRLNSFSCSDAQARRTSRENNNNNNNNNNNANSGGAREWTAEDYRNAFFYYAHCCCSSSSSSGPSSRGAEGEAVRGPSPSNGSAPSPADNPWESAITALMLGALADGIAAPPLATQLTLGQTLVTLLSHLHTFFQVSKLHCAIDCNDSNASYPSFPTNNKDYSNHHGGCNGSDHTAHNGATRDARAGSHELHCDGMMHSPEHMMRWIGLWRELLTTALSQYKERAWALMQRAMEEANEQVGKQLIQWLQYAYRNRSNSNNSDCSSSSNSSGREDIDMNLYGDETSSSSYSEAHNDDAQELEEEEEEEEDGDGVANRSEEEEEERDENIAHASITGARGSGSSADQQHQQQQEQEQEQKHTKNRDGDDKIISTWYTRSPSVPAVVSEIIDGMPASSNGSMAVVSALLQQCPVEWPTLRSINRRVHAAAALEPRQLLFTSSFMESLTACIRALPPPGRRAAGAGNGSSMASSKIDNADTNNHNNNNNNHNSEDVHAARYHGQKGAWKRAMPGTPISLEDREAAQLAEDFCMASVYLKRVFTLLFEY